MPSTHRRLLLTVLFLAAACGTPAASDAPSTPDASPALDGSLTADTSVSMDAALDDALALSDALADGGLPGDASPDGPPITTPAPLLTGRGDYPRAILTKSGAIVASVVAPQPSGRNGGTILRSTDDGLHFAVVGHVNDPVAAHGLCCATLFELPRPLGALPAGALLWAAAVGANAPTEAMSIPVFRSVDLGATWSLLSTAFTAPVPESAGGLWEPEFSMLDDGTLVCHFSDETEPGHSQVLAEIRTLDGVTWTARTDTVALAAPGARPGMANVRRGPGGVFFMSYELCGIQPDPCAAHLRTSTDGWNWGDPADAGLLPKTVQGHEFRHAPTLAYDETPGENGRLYLVGQMVYDDAGPAPENGAVLLANTERGSGYWYEIAAPVPVAVPIAPPAGKYLCPNYSSTLLPLDEGTVVLEIAPERLDGGTDCYPFFARGGLLGTGDDAGSP